MKIKVSGLRARVFYAVLLITSAAVQVAPGVAESFDVVVDPNDPNDPNQPYPPPEPDQFEPDDAAHEAAPIACNTSQEHTISPAGEQDWLSFSLAERSQVVAYIGFARGSFPDLSLLTSGGALIDRSSVISHVCGQDALAAGDYLLRATDRDAAAYGVSLSCIPCRLPNPTPTASPSPSVAPTVQPDVFEAAEGDGSAVTITCGETVARSIAPRGDLDRFSLSLPSRMQVVVQTVVSPGINPWVSLIDDGESDYNRVDRLCGSDALDAGRHEITVEEGYGAPELSYALNVVCRPCTTPNPTATSTATPTRTPTTLPSDEFEPDDSIAEAKPIECGTTQGHTFSSSNDEDWLRLSLTTASQVTIQARGDDRSDGYVGLYSANSSYVDAAYSRLDRACGLDALSAGDYYIRITPTNSHGYGYEVAVHCLPCSVPNATPTATRPATVTPTPPMDDAFEPDDDLTSAHPILCGASESHTTSADDDVDSFRLSLSGLTQVTFEITGTYTGIELWSDAEPFAYDYQSISRVCGVDALPAGDYYFAVHNLGSFSFFGSPFYEVHVRCSACTVPNPTPTNTLTPTPTATALGVDDFEPDDDPATASAITCGELQHHTISAYHDGDWTKLVLPASQQVTIQAASPAGQPIYVLVGQNGGVIDGGWSRVNRLCGLNPLAAGTYEIRANSPGGDWGFGYDLVVNCLECVVPTPGPTATATPPPCTGDCDDSAAVTVDEILTGVNLALGTSLDSPCPRFDTDGSGTVTVNEILAAVTAALTGCS